MGNPAMALPLPATDQMHYELAIPEADFLRHALEFELHLIVSSNCVLVAVRRMPVLRSTNISVRLLFTE
jgi:hypothetical protein